MYLNPKSLDDRRKVNSKNRCMLPFGQKAGELFVFQQVPTQRYIEVPFPTWPFSSKVRREKRHHYYPQLQAWWNTIKNLLVCPLKPLINRRQQREQINLLRESMRIYDFYTNTALPTEPRTPLLKSLSLLGVSRSYAIIRQLPIRMLRNYNRFSRTKVSLQLEVIKQAWNIKYGCQFIVHGFF